VPGSPSGWSTGSCGGASGRRPRSGNSGISPAYRQSLIEERTREANRLHKLLEDTGIKLASVAPDMLGISGRAMLEVLGQGTTDPARLADWARGRLRAKLLALRQAWRGGFGPITRSWSVSGWLSWTIWTRRSIRSGRASLR
jgi:hypothetical protein